ncbi:MAG: hypothetical protein EB023_11605, partial [Flavobacteriia bacterium]|nr:hypothetical protein [Flavobacteriia bacterium]
MKTKFFFIVLFFGAIVFAQDTKILGTCIDKKGIPLSDVKVFILPENKLVTATNQDGQFTFLSRLGDTLWLLFNYDSLIEERKFVVAKSPVFTLPTVLFQIQIQQTVVVQRIKEDPFSLVELPKIDLQQLISVEKYLTLTQPATSNNELTSNYNVRGGSYDENLVYVNGFLVYRPFLTRSGQQEGLSFIHSSLVESVKFSAGGFDAQYGDRLSSVLDITYKTPTVFKSSIALGLLSEEAHIEGTLGKRFTYLAGGRYRANGYLLNSLPTKGAYNPVFSDGQFLGTYAINEQLSISLLGHYSSNLYRFAPQTSNTDFGTANEAYSFRIYFDGQESTRFQTSMVGTKLHYTPNTKTQLDFFVSTFQSDEREYFDIQGQYYINELETDPSKEEYGDSIAVLGIGSFLNHARNRLNANIFNIYHEGTYQFKGDYTDFYKTRFVVSQLKWGIGYEFNRFQDVLSEWKMIDSAGYSVPVGNDAEIKLFETIKSNLLLDNHKANAYLQWNFSRSKKRFLEKVTLSKSVKEKGKKERKTYTETFRESSSKFAFSIGTRAGYTLVNEEGYITPRLSLSYYPRAYMVKDQRIIRRNLSYRFAAGTYYQPPIYREFRTYNGTLNTSVQAQKSVHAVLGTDLYFNLWKRDKPFKFSGELFYKYLWDVNP